MKNVYTKVVKVKQTVPEAIIQVIKNSDIILCVLDARYISETRNIYIEEKMKEMNKKIIYIVNKIDLVRKIDHEELEKFSPSILVSCWTRKGVNELRTQIKIMAKQLNKEPVYVGVVGYPNTGKSSVINLILGRKEIVKTSSVAGFTKGVQMLKFGDGINIYDSPGVIPPTERFANSTKLAKIGVKSFDRTEDPEMFVHELMKEYPGLFERYYKINTEGDSEKFIEEFGKKRGTMLKKGEIDTDRAARMILRDWQCGKIKAK